MLCKWREEIQTVNILKLRPKMKLTSHNLVHIGLQGQSQLTKPLQSPFHQTMLDEQDQRKVTVVMPLCSVVELWETVNESWNAHFSFVAKPD